MKKSILLICLLLTGCTHSVHQVSLSGFFDRDSIKASKPVEGYAERKSILGFNSDNFFVDQAKENLESKCRKGKIVGITAEYMTSHGFFHWTDKLYLKGHCVR